MVFLPLQNLRLDDYITSRYFVTTKAQLYRLSIHRGKSFSVDSNVNISSMSFMYMTVNKRSFIVCECPGDHIKCSEYDKYNLTDVTLVIPPTFDKINVTLNMAIIETGLLCVQFKQWIRSLVKRFVNSSN